MFSLEEQEQYSRQIRLEGFGESAQLKLQSARVLVIGAGALGCPVLQYLTAAGVGKIGIVDGDTIERSNLHRQVLYTENDLGKGKVATAKKRLQEMNPNIQIDIFAAELTIENAYEIANNYDIVIDGTDNFPTRYLINDLCFFTKKSNVHGSIQQFSGQVALFNVLQEDGTRSPNYRDLFPEPPNPQETISCAEGGVIGVLPGVIGGIMAMETIKLITGIGQILIGKLYQYNSLNNQNQLFNFSFDNQNPLRGNPAKQLNLIDYNEFCGIKKSEKMNEITVYELKIMLENQDDYQLVDVREKDEFEEANLGGDHIPLGELSERYMEISKDKKVVVHCKMGGRSANAIQYLQNEHGFKNLYNLQGGIMAWQSEIDR